MAPRLIHSSLEIAKILVDFKDLYETTSREDEWYLTAVGAFIGSNCAYLCGDLYQFLLKIPEYASSRERRRLVCRLREAMIQCILLCGMPTVYQAIESVACVEDESDKDYSSSRDDWRHDDDSEERGRQALQFLYRDDDAKITEKLHAHRDFATILNKVSSGLLVADYKILNFHESELVTIAAVMCQNQRESTYWHLRGCLRAGISREDVEKIQQCIETVGCFAVRPIDDVGRVSDVTDDAIGTVSISFL